MRTVWTLLIPALLLGHLVCLQGAGQPVQDCCLLTSARRIPFNSIAGYEIQSRDKGCPIDAVIFETNSNPSRKLCATSGISWVNKWIKKLDKRKKVTKTEKKPKRSARPQPE
ncbi:regakine-1-like [Hyla sarda]|uniref:regakine-1-like n=1 Tax=Hyla sarda TaxID=327740 RepID=UPI0024C3180E|nr:regakine-1-like [Hyla sarda]